jgi:dihydroorotate dehydrogenase
VGTANYLNPLAAVEIAEGIEAYAAERDLARIADLVGSLEWPEGR